MAPSAHGTRIRKLILAAGTAGLIAMAVLGGYRFATRDPVAPGPADTAIAPAPRAVVAPLCSGTGVVGASRAVCKRSVASETKAVHP